MREGAPSTGAERSAMRASGDDGEQVTVMMSELRRDERFASCGDDERSASDGDVTVGLVYWGLVLVCSVLEAFFFFFFLLR